MLNDEGEVETKDDTTSKEPECSETKETVKMTPHELLSEGLMGQILPELRTIQEKLEDVTKNQGVLQQVVNGEGEKMATWNANKELEMYMAEVKHYQAKLVKIRKDMLRITEKTSKMKEKSEELRNKKEKEELHKQEKKRSEVEQERSLIATTAAGASKPPNQL